MREQTSILRSARVLLFRQMIRIAEEQHQVKDDQLARLVDVDADEVWRLLDAEIGDLSDLVHGSTQVAAVDGQPTKKERAVLAAIEERCRRE